MKGRGRGRGAGAGPVGSGPPGWSVPRMLQQGISTYHRLHTSSFTIDAILGLPQSAIDYSTSSTGDKEKCERSRKSKCKRVRTIFTAEQLERLEAEFERQQYMVGPERLYLAHALRLTEAQVKVWFQNRRIKWRKQHLELEQQRLAAMKRHRELSEASTESEEERTTQCENYTSTEVKQCPTHQ